MTREEFVPGSAPLVRHSDREILSTAPGNVTGLVMDSDATGGAVSVLNIYLPKGADGAAPHFHTRSTELFYLVSGRSIWCQGGWKSWRAIASRFWNRVTRCWFRS